MKESDGEREKQETRVVLTISERPARGRDNHSQSCERLEPCFSRSGVILLCRSLGKQDGERREQTEREEEEQKDEEEEGEEQ